MSAPRPSHIKLHKLSKTLELTYPASDQNTCTYHLSCEYLRVMSPSAEVRGHGDEPPKLQFGKRDVAITHVSSVGNYALKFDFDDGHDSGIYSWDYLYDLAIHQEQHWAHYLEKLKEENRSRDSMFINIKQL